MQPARSKILIFIAIIAVMAIGAHVDVPMHPVPMTLQSLGVILAGLWLGPLLGPLAVVVYLGLALVGLPVLAEGAHGLAPFVGATAGYIYGFLLVAALGGLLARHPKARHPLIGIAGLFGLHLVLLTMGAVWLSTSIGLSPAVAVGFAPFLIGALVKSALGWAIWHYSSKPA